MIAPRPSVRPSVSLPPDDRYQAHLESLARVQRLLRQMAQEGALEERPAPTQSALGWALGPALPSWGLPGSGHRLSPLAPLSALLALAHSVPDPHGRWRKALASVPEAA